MDKYDEALAKARAGKSLEEIFPELKESEDERIRRHLIDIVETYWGKTNEPGKAADLAWLERQKEQKPSAEEVLVKAGLKPYKDGNQWCILVGDNIQEGICGFGDTIDDALYEFLMEVLNLRKEQKPAEWSKEDEEMRITILQDIANIKAAFPKVNIQPEFDWLKSLPERFNLQPKNEWSEDWREENIQTRFAFYTYKDDPSVLYLSNVFVEEMSRNHGFGTRILRAAEKVAEAIGATTISLKVKQNSPANAWYRKNGYGYVAFEDGYDWLEKNLEYMKPNKQEWSEEEIRTILDDFAECKDTYTSCINRLKSLRPLQYCENCKLKRSVENWKPSEEQMEALDGAQGELCGTKYNEGLCSLIDDLKKLSYGKIH